jgi:hypothetical protein
MIAATPEEPSSHSVVCRHIQATPRGESPCLEETSRNIPASRIGKRSISRKVTKAAAFRKRKLNVAPGPPSTKTTAAESGLADRGEASRQVIPPRIRVAGAAAPPQPRDPRQADPPRPKKPPRLAGATPPTRHIEPGGRRRDKGPSNRLLFCSGSDGACPRFRLKAYASLLQRLKIVLSPPMGRSRCHSSPPEFR